METGRAAPGRPGAAGDVGDEGSGRPARPEASRRARDAFARAPLASGRPGCASAFPSCSNWWASRRIATSACKISPRACCSASASAQALIHEPELIFLDEPTSGLDPMGRRLVRDIIRAQRDRGATVFLNSHLLSEIEITCDEVVFIRDGEVVTHRDLHLHEEEVRVVVRARKLTREAVAGLAPWSTARSWTTSSSRLPHARDDVLPDILRHLVAAGADVYQFTPQRLSLEELFVQSWAKTGACDGTVDHGRHHLPRGGAQENSVDRARRRRRLSDRIRIGTALPDGRFARRATWRCFCATRF